MWGLHQAVTVVAAGRSLAEGCLYPLVQVHIPKSSEHAHALVLFQLSYHLLLREGRKKSDQDSEAKGISWISCSFPCSAVERPGVWDLEWPRWGSRSTFSWETAMWVPTHITEMMDISWKKTSNHEVKMLFLSLEEFLSWRAGFTAEVWLHLYVYFLLLR